MNDSNIGAIVTMAESFSGLILRFADLTANSIAASLIILFSIAALINPVRAGYSSLSRSLLGRGVSLSSFIVTARNLYKIRVCH
jgi:hypothetical protein